MISSKSFNFDFMNIYSHFVKYFGDLTMTKIKDLEINNRKFSYYAAEIQSYLGINRRYVIAISARDFELMRKTKKLSQLDWVSLQTRTLEENMNLVKQQYIPKRLPELNHEIIRRSDGTYNYDCPKIPNLLTTLLKTDNNVHYVDRGNTIIEAIETYSTIFSFKN